jgi:hypothetical protein
VARALPLSGCCAAAQYMYTPPRRRETHHVVLRCPRPASPVTSSPSRTAVRSIVCEFVTAQAQAEARRGSRGMGGLP